MHRWNLLVLANALNQICDENKLNEYMKTFLTSTSKIYLELINKRLGLDASKSGDSNLQLILRIIR